MLQQMTYVGHCLVAASVANAVEEGLVQYCAEVLRHLSLLQFFCFQGAGFSCFFFKWALALVLQAF